MQTAGKTSKQSSGRDLEFHCWLNKMSWFCQLSGRNHSADEWQNKPSSFCSQIPWHLHKVALRHPSRHLLMSTGRGEGVALHPTLGYFYSWERRWWTWTRGLENFLIQLTKAVKWKPDLRRLQIPRSAASNVSLAMNPKGPYSPERNFPGSAQADKQNLPEKYLCPSGVYSWNRCLEVRSICSHPGGHSFRG